MLEQGARGGRGPRSFGLPGQRDRVRPDRPESRIEALTKLKALFDSGVLTARQYEDERDRLLGE
jgi:hypothetical protein